MVHCPHCGADAYEQQKFCEGCRGRIVPIEVDDDFDLEAEIAEFTAPATVALAAAPQAPQRGCGCTTIMGVVFVLMVIGAGLVFIFEFPLQTIALCLVALVGFVVVGWWLRR